MVVPLFDMNKTKRFPWITVLLIAINVFIFAFIQPQSGQAQTRFELQHAMIPCELTQDAPVRLVRAGPNLVAAACADSTTPSNSIPLFPDKNVWLAVIASMFLHASWLHLLGNMLFLWVFGNNVEDRFGRIGYLLLYFLGGFAAAATQVLSNTHSVGPVLGASGAIACVMGAYLVLYPRSTVFCWVAPLIIVVAPFPAFVVLLLWFFLQFFTGNTGVAWMAHVGGFVFGAAVAWLLRRALRPDTAVPVAPKYLKAFPPAIERPAGPGGFPPGPYPPGPYPPRPNPGPYGPPPAPPTSYPPPPPPPPPEPDAR